jgi:hypothetical protein
MALGIGAAVLLGLGIVGSPTELLAAAILSGGSLLLLAIAVGRIRSS